MLTITELRHCPHGADRWISDGGVRGCGALWARISSGGACFFYFRYTDRDGNKKAVALGPHDESGTRGLTLAEARDKAGTLSKLYRDGVKNLHEHLRRESEAVERARRAEDEGARRAVEQSQRGTLRQLLEVYVDYLERARKPSAADVRSIFDHHVLRAAPHLANRRAAELTVRDAVGLIRRLVEAGKGRTAGKLRSYLRAAYSLAVRSAMDPAMPETRTFGIDANPVASIDWRWLARFNRTRDRALSGNELGALLRRLETRAPGGRRDALQLCLLLGGQRPTQLLRVRRIDVDLSKNLLTLYDPKGTRRRPRVHRLPLTKDAAAILQVRLQHAHPNGKLFTSSVETLSALISRLSDEMVKAGEASEPFQLADLRRTTETMLAALKVSGDVRAQLLSHGLGGIQHRHYDRHDYMIEKREALEKWERHLAALKSAGKRSGNSPTFES